MSAATTQARARYQVCQAKGFCNRSDLFCVDTVTLLHCSSMVTLQLPVLWERMQISNVSVPFSPVQVFRTDLITAMKLHDSYQLNPDEYYVLADPWRQEWEKGVQVPVSPGTIPQPVAR